MLNKKMNLKKKGLTLIELLIVLGVGGGVVAGALVLVGNVMSERDTKQHSENISTIYNNMQNLFADEDIVDTTSVLITAGIFPNSLKINEDTGTVKNAGGGNVEIQKWGTDGYTLHYEKIKVNTCVDVLKAQKSVGWDTFTVVKNGSGLNPESGTNYDTDGTVTTFASECATAAADTDWVDVGFGIE